MRRGDLRDIVGGLLVIIVGGTFAYAATRYSFGSGRVIGAAYLPFSAGVITMVLGLGVLIPALFRQGSSIDIGLRPVLAVLTSVLAFGLLIQRTGLIIALIAVVILSALGSRQSRWWQVVPLAVFMSLACWLIFVRGLGLPMPVLRNPL